MLPSGMLNNSFFLLVLLFFFYFFVFSLMYIAIKFPHVVHINYSNLLDIVCNSLHNLVIIKALNNEKFTFFSCSTNWLVHGLFSYHNNNLVYSLRKLYKLLNMLDVRLDWCFHWCDAVVETWELPELSILSKSWYILLVLRCEIWRAFFNECLIQQHFFMLHYSPVEFCCEILMMMMMFCIHSQKGWVWEPDDDYVCYSSTFSYKVWGIA